MDLTSQEIRAALDRVEVQGWECAEGRDLLELVRHAIVRPLVRRSGLRGPAADQAEASGWEAAWDALRRPAARSAANPAGMVWVAARRAVHAEVGPRIPPLPAQGSPPVPARSPLGSPAVGPAVTSDPWTAHDRGAARGHLSLDVLLERGWQPGAGGHSPTAGPGPLVSSLVAGLVDAGWEPGDALEAIAVLSEHAVPGTGGRVVTRWRRAARKLGVPEWRARRLAELLVGTHQGPGLLELAATHGTGIFRDPAVQAALRSTTRRWSAGPPVWLMGWQPAQEGVPA